MTVSLRNIARHSAIYSAGDLLGKGLAFVMIPIYTHYLHAEQYGILEMLELSSYIFGFIISMGISQSTLRHYQEFEKREEKEKVLSVAIISLLLISAVSLLLLFAFSAPISKLVLGSAEHVNLFKLMLAALVIGINSEIPLTLLRLNDQSLKYVSISLAKLIVSFSLNIFFVVYLEQGVKGILISGLITSLLLTSITLFITLSSIKLSFSFALARTMLGYGVPLVGSWFGMYILNFSDRFVLRHFTSLEQVGVYSLAYKFGMLPNMIILAPFVMFWGTKQFERITLKNSSEVFGKVCTYLFLVETFACLGIMLLVKSTIIYLTTPEYVAAAEYVPLIVLGYLSYSLYSFSQVGLLAQKKTGFLSAMVLAAAVFNTSANLVLVSYYQAWGAALATLLSFALLSTLTAFVSQRFYQIQYEYLRLLKIIFSAFVLYCAASFQLGSESLSSFIARLLIALLFPVVLYFVGFYRDEELKEIKNMKHYLSGKLRLA